MKRRTFFDNAGRWSALFLLTGMSGYLLSKKGGLSVSCQEQLICKQCRQFAGCRKPKALIFQHNLRQEEEIKK